MISISEIYKTDPGRVKEVHTLDTAAELGAALCELNWSPGLFSENKRRNANFLKTNLFVLDVDEGCSLSYAKEFFKEYKHIIATSKSHGIEKNGVVADRFRVVLFLDRPILSDAHFKEQFAAFAASFPHGDPACKDAARFYYPCKEVVSLREDGLLVEVVPEPNELDALLKAEEASASRNGLDSSEKGVLRKDTLEFLMFGAPPGHRHNALVKAVPDLREQNYSLDDIETLLEDLATRTGDTAFSPTQDRNTRKTLDDMMKRPLKEPFREPEGEKIVGSVHVGSLLDEVFEALADKDAVKGEPTGFSGLDRMLGGGLREGELTVLMAQAKTGKNAFMHDVLHKMLNKGHAFAYASRELSPVTEVLPNLLSIELGENAWLAEINPTFKERALRAASTWDLSFAPGYGVMPIGDVRRWFEAEKERGVKYFLFDHYHYALENEQYENVTQTIREFKSIVKELSVHLFMIVQPRSLRENEKLSLATLRGGAAIGQALDNLLIMERRKLETHDNVAELRLEVARHRLANPGKIHVQYDKKTTRFEEIKIENIAVEEREPPRKMLNAMKWPGLNS